MKLQDEFGRLAIERKIKDLFNGTSFSICDLDSLAELMDVSPDQSIRKQLSAYHCVSFSDMSHREKELIQDKVVECLRGDTAFNPARLLHQLTDEGQNFAPIEDRYIDVNQKVSRITKN